MYILPGGRHLAPMGVKICMMVELCPMHTCMGFSTFGGDIFRAQYGSANRGGGQNVFLAKLSSRYSFGDLCHIQLSTHVWPCHS